MSQVRIAITHASSMLAEALLGKLSASGMQPDSIVLLDIEEQAGNRLAFADTYITVLDQMEYDYEDLAAILLLQQDNELGDLLQHADCPVISHYPEPDKSAHFYEGDTDKNQPIESTAAIKLTNAESSTLLSVLAPLRDELKIKTLNVVNVLSASSFGKSAVDELASQTIELLNGREVTTRLFPMQQAFNMIPQQGAGNDQQMPGNFFADEMPGYSVQSILVPAFHGLSISVNIEAESDIDLQAVKRIMGDLPELQISDEPVSPYTDCKEGNKWIIFGLNQAQNDTKRLQFWIISDSIRNGLINNYQNAIEFLLNSHL